MRSLVVALLLALSLVACKQGEGETCQINSDCEDGLRCVLENTNMVCRKPSSGIDAGPEPDAAPPGPDATPGPDAAPVDAAPVDGATPDA